MHTAQEAAHAAGGLSAAVGDDAVVLLPEAVLVEAAPDGVFFDVQDEFRLALFELDDVGLADAGHGVARGTHRGAVECVAGIDQGDGPGR